MRPVLIVQHLSGDGPAYLATWLQDQQVAFDVCNVDAGQMLPPDLSQHSALAVLGGEMSANDPLPHLRQVEALMGQAFDRGVPVLGHCLGGQLMARALGAAVVTSPAPEIGWQTIDIAATPAARHWLLSPGAHVVFQWHYDAFELPPGTERLAGSATCPNQVFAFGPHLAMQFHVELDASKLAAWTQDDGQRYLQALRSSRATVQTGAEMLGRALQALPLQQRLAGHVYERWLSARAI